MTVSVLLAVTIGWGALAFGAVYPWAYLPLLVMAALSGGAAWMTADSPRPARTLVGATLVTLGAIAVQLAPLEAGTIQFLTPGTDRLLSQLDIGYAAGSSSPAGASHPLSVSPEMTRVGLVFLACAAVLTLGTAQWLTRERLRSLAGTIVAVGVLLALAGIIQRATSPTLIYGVWKPFQGTDPFGPFVNKNHFAGWMLMGLPVALGMAAGLAVRGHGRLARDWRSRLVILAEAEASGAIIVLFSAFLMVMSLLFTLSRSGITAGVIATAVAVAVTASVFRGWRRVAVVAVVAGIIVGAVAWVGVDLITARFSALDTVSYGSRAQIWHDTWRMVKDVPLVGVGMRAYTVANLVYQTALPDMHVGAAHNDWLQLIAEGGLLVGIPALCLLAMLVTQGARRFGEHRAAQDLGTSYWIRVGAATGILAVSLQSLVEFSLQMPGNTMMFAILWAMVIAPLPMPRPA